jgi:hypothetical protein
MPQQGNILLADSQPTPVTHTFAPNGASLEYTSWQDRVGGIALLYPSIALMIRRAPNAEGNEVYRWKLDLPVGKSIDGPAVSGYTPGPQKDYSIVYDLRMSVPLRASAQARSDAAAYFAASCFASPFVILAETGEPVY